MELGVHFNIVAEAYRQVADQGWLELKHGRAAIVLERATPSPRSRPPISASGCAGCSADAGGGRALLKNRR